MRGGAHIARTYFAAQDGWNHPGSSFRREKVGEQVRYRGTYLVGSIVTRFSLNSQRDKQAGHYLWRGTLSILDSKGFVLQVEGDARRKIEKRLKEREPDYVPGTRREELNAAMALHCQDIEEAEMRAYIARSAVHLCEKHLDAIRMDWARGEKAKDATLLDAWLLLQGKFRKEFAKRSRGYQEEVCGSVERLCAALSRLPMSRLTPAMVNRYATDQGNEDRARRDIERTAKFWDLCHQQRLCAGENPFTTWLGQHRKEGRVNATAALASASAQTALTQEQEEALYAIIREGWQDGRVRALMLGLENGLTAREISRLRVRDLVFQNTPPYVLIRRQKEHLRSATHNYTVPAAPLCGKILRSWYKELQQANPDRVLDSFSVCGEGTTFLPVRTIQDFCRWSLTKVGVAGGSVGKRRPTFELLRENFRHRLLTFCGLRDEPGAVNFLMGSSLADDTTSDHYRSFTDPEGQAMLYRALARDRRFCARPRPENPETNPEREIWTFPDRPDERGELSAVIRAKAGSVITIQSPNGVGVSWRAEAVPQHADANPEEDMTSFGDGTEK